jgi:hypothetical protein
MQKWIRDITLEKYIGQLRVGLEIDKQTRIASMGSCFAREIRNYLLSNGYNYLLAEQDKNPWLTVDPRYKPNQHGSAAWDRVFNTYTFADLVSASFGCRISRIYKYDKGVADLIRTRVCYRDEETAFEDIGDHNAQSAQILTSADVLILTLGLTEVWSHDGLVLPYKPEYIETRKLQFRCTTTAENCDNLERGWNQLKMANPELKLLLTLSPIHMNATFRDDVDVFSASCASKSILRAAIDSFMSNCEDVYYFPSYEITTILCQELGVKPYRDGHHISKEAFALISAAFESNLNPKEKP